MSTHCHVYCETNFYADFLSHQAYGFYHSVHVLSSPPDGMVPVTTRLHQHHLFSLIWLPSKMNHTEASADVQNFACSRPQRLFRLLQHALKQIILPRRLQLLYSPNQNLLYGQRKMSRRVFACVTNEDISYIHSDCTIFHNIFRQGLHDWIIG